LAPPPGFTRSVTEALQLAEDRLFWRMIAVVGGFGSMLHVKVKMMMVIKGLN